MSVLGYVFLALEKEHFVTIEEQQTALGDYAQSVGMAVDEFFVEEDASLKRPFMERDKGRLLVDRCAAGDAIIIMRAAWILNSAGEGFNLLQRLREKEIALYCVDIGENISLDEKRKLVVYEGCARIVQKLLSALAVSEGSMHGEAIRATKRNLKKQGKYIGGPVPFGWKVNEERVLVQNEAQQKIIQKIIAMREERWSYRDISKKLDVEFDIQLSHAGIRRILEGNIKRKSEALAAVVQQN